MGRLEHAINRTKYFLGKSLPANALRQHYGLEDYNAIVIDNLRLVYVPIPKSASRSVKSALAKTIDLDYEVSAHRAIWKKVDVDRLPLDGYSQFTVVRNPINRLVSCYKQKFLHPYRAPNRVFWKYGRAIRSNFSFAEFAHFVIKTPDKFSDRHFKSQHKLLGKNLNSYDKIIRFENIESEWKIMMEEHGLSSLPYFNKSKEPDSEIRIDDKLREQLYHRYRVDFETFNYSRNLL